ncbi:MAG: hypothetical protein V4622_10830 [Bacteroidota bacterium]
MLKLKTKDFLKSAAYNLVFKTKDQILVTSLDNYRKKLSQDEDGINRLGINFGSEVIIFGEEFEGGQNFVALVELSKPDLFKKNISDFLASNQTFEVKNDIGFIVTHFSDKTISKSKLQHYLKSLKQRKKSESFDNLKGSSSKSSSTNLNPLSSDSFFDLNFDSFTFNDEIQSKKGKISCKINETSMDFSGQISMLNPPLIESKWSLISDGLHIETAMISNAIQDSIQKYFSKIGLKTPNIQRISMNYYGMELQEGDKGLVLAPVFDLLLTFKDDYNVDEIFSDFSILESFGFEKENKIISTNGINYFIDRIDDKNLFLGCNLKNVIHRKNNTLFEVNGEVTRLTTLKGGGFITSFVQVLPPFKSSKNLLSSIDKIHIKSKQINKRVELFGNVTFKKDRYSYNELLRFYLGFIGEL